MSSRSAKRTCGRGPRFAARASANVARRNVASSQPQLISAEAAAALVRSGDWVDYGGNISQPDLFDRALAARASELRDVKIARA